MQSAMCNIMAVSHFSGLATVIICIILSQTLMIHGGQPKKTIHNFKPSDRQDEESNPSSFSTKAHNPVSFLNDAWYARFMNQQFGNNLDHRLHEHKNFRRLYGNKIYRGLKETMEKMPSHIPARSFRQSLSSKPVLRLAKRRKRSSSQKDELDPFYEKERNKSKVVHDKAPDYRQQMSGGLPDYDFESSLVTKNSRIVPKENVLKDDVIGSSNSNSDFKSSDDSSTNPLIYILPAILALLVVTLVVTLLMYRVQKRKATLSSPKHKAKHREQASQGDGDEREEEAIELVEFAEYHPCKERGLMDGFADDEGRSYREPLMSEKSRSNVGVAAMDIPDTFESNPKRPVRTDKRTRDRASRDFQRQDSLHSPTRSDEEMGPLEKIYISIPPRPPSENYIEATSTSTSVSSTKSVNVPKLEWLTKSSMIDAKNEASSYHSDMGTQTIASVGPLCSKTVFGTPWQFGGTFIKNGGVLQAANSDVSLTLVPRSIAAKDYVDIYGAVFTETQDIRKKFDIPANEILITPLVEYNASGNYKFHRHVKIGLPHALPEDSDVESLKVYGFSVDELGNVSVQHVPYQNEGNARWDRSCFWEMHKNEQNIQIWTLHFSGYFCTACESKSSMSSVCARIFGSHVQIKSRRREIRIIMYIWDRRLNIRDFLQRIIEQECDMDRQLLADQQIPLPENATSDSHVVMKMDTLGDEEDRLCWRHVMRPNANARRPLFKPLQTRKLFQIIHCCQQSDPLRVEWAMENTPDSVPSSVFQCCIDVLHVPESTTNFEEALEDADEDYMRTFYVRDLKLSEGYPQSNKNLGKPQVSGMETELHLKRALAELNRQETESMCEAFGLARKDIGNLSRKFSSEAKVKHGLVEECCRRVGQDHFLHHLPEVLKQMGLYHALDLLHSKQRFSPSHATLPQTSISGKVNNTAISMTEQSVSHTEQKQFLLSPSNMNCNFPSNFKGLQKQISEQSNEVFYTDDNSSHHYPINQVNVQVRYPDGDANGNHCPSVSPQSSQSRRSHGDRDPASLYHLSQSFDTKARLHSSRIPQPVKQQQVHVSAKGPKSSSTGSDSVLRGNSIVSSDVAMSSVDDLSTQAQVDSKEYRLLHKADELEEFEEETFKKEVAGAENRGVMIGFPEIKEETLASNHGPVALPHDNKSGPRNGVVPSKSKSLSNGLRNMYHENQSRHQPNSHSNNTEETFCKQSFETFV